MSYALVYFIVISVDQVSWSVKMEMKAVCVCICVELLVQTCKLVRCVYVHMVWIDNNTTNTVLSHILKQEAKLLLG